MMRIYLHQIQPALLAFFRSLPSWFGTRYLWILLLVPALGSIVFYKLADANIMGWRDSSQCKMLMEIIHPSLLAAGMLLAFFGWLFSRNPSLAFIGMMSAFALARELGGQGTSFILYIGLVGLITYGYGNRDKLLTLLESRLASSLMATGFIIYALSQLLDRGIIKRLGWLLLGDTSWKPPYSSQIEECLEALGGGFLMLTVWVLIVVAVRDN